MPLPTGQYAENCIKYAKIRVFSDPHSFIQGHNLRLFDSVLIRQNMAHEETVFTYILRGGDLKSI